MPYTFTPFGGDELVNSQRYSDLLAQDPQAAAMALLSRGGYQSSPANMDMVSGLAPLLEVLRGINVANSGVANATGTESVNAFGKMLQALISPRSMTTRAGGAPDLVGGGLEGLQNLAASNMSNLNTGTRSFLSDPGAVFNDARALLAQRLGGSLASRFLGNFAMREYLAKMANMETNNGGNTNPLALLQAMGFLSPGGSGLHQQEDYKTDKPDETVKQPKPQDELTPGNRPKMPGRLKPGATSPEMTPGQYNPVNQRFKAASTGATPNAGGSPWMNGFLSKYGMRA